MNHLFLCDYSQGLNARDSFVDFLRCWREKTLHTELSGDCFCHSFETRVSDQDRLTYDAALHQKPGQLCLN